MKHGVLNKRIERHRRYFGEPLLKQHKKKALTKILGKTLEC
jgi:hypothetical protein